MNLFSPLSDIFGKPYDEVSQIASECTLCDLHKQRTRVVFGTGPVPSHLMLIGEAPGEQEDQQGLPFVGRAGQLLSKILESVNISRETDIYITNIVKCRPPENRTPTTLEADTCHPYLQAQIRLVRPKIILLAGAPSVKTVLKIDDPISQIRGKWFTLPETDISVMPIFHPSYLLRNPSKEPGSPKWLTWQDMKEVRTALDLWQKVSTVGTA